MKLHYHCYRCQAPKTRPELTPVERDKTCFYLCLACGAESGLWLLPVREPTAAPHGETP